LCGWSAANAFTQRRPPRNRARPAKLSLANGAAGAGAIDLSLVVNEATQLNGAFSRLDLEVGNEDRVHP
jgi:hypothetical protein